MVIWRCNPVRQPHAGRTCGSIPTLSGHRREIEAWGGLRTGARLSQSVAKPRHLTSTHACVLSRQPWVVLKYESDRHRSHACLSFFLTALPLAQPCTSPTAYLTYEMGSTVASSLGIYMKQKSVCRDGSLDKQCSFLGCRLGTMPADG